MKQLAVVVDDDDTLPSGADSVVGEDQQADDEVEPMQQLY